MRRNHTDWSWRWKWDWTCMAWEMLLFPSWKEETKRAGVQAVEGLNYSMWCQIRRSRLGEFEIKECIYLFRSHTQGTTEAAKMHCLHFVSFVFAQNTHMQINILGDCLPPSMCSFQYWWGGLLVLFLSSICLWKCAETTGRKADWKYRNKKREMHFQGDNGRAAEHGTRSLRVLLARMSCLQWVM